MLKLEKLYKIDSLGKLREWTMHIEGDSFYAVKGLVWKKLTQDKPTHATAKNVGRSNETSDEEQAELEAKARWDKKLKEGYALTPEDAESKKYYDPMLAQKFEDRLDRVNAEWKDDSISPKIRQTLQHWGYKLTKKDFEKEVKKRTNV